MSFSLIWESQDQVAAASDESIENIQAGVDSQVLQNSEAAQVVLDDAASADKVVQGVGQLTQVKDFVDSQATQGGMSEQTAQLAQIHVESICAAMRMPVRSSIIPKAENFGSGGSKLQSTYLASEGISDSIKTGWEALKKFLAGLMERARNTWSNLWNNTMLLEKKLQSLEKNLTDLKGDAGTDDINIAGDLKLLGQKTFDPAASLQATMPIQKALSTVKNGIDAIKNATLSFSSKSFGSNVSGGSAVTREFAKGIAKNYGASGDWKEESGTAVAQSDMLPGGRVIRYSVSGKDEDGASLSIEIVREELKGATEKIKPLDRAALKAAIGEARKSFDSLKKLKEDGAELKKHAKDIDDGLNAAIKAMQSKPSDAKDAEKAEQTKAVETYISRVKVLYSVTGTFSAKLAALIPTMTGEQIRGIMSVCSKSMSTYKEKSKD